MDRITIKDLVVCVKVLVDNVKRSFGIGKEDRQHGNP